MDALEQLVSMIVRMVSKPPDCGSLVIKSIAMDSKGHALSAGVIGNMGGWVGYSKWRTEQIDKITWSIPHGHT